MSSDDKKDKKKPTPKSNNLAELSKLLNKYMGGDIALDLEDPDNKSTNPYQYATGILSLDRALGIGALIGGSILTIHGWNGTGKTLAALTLASAMQRQGCRVAYIDAEGTLSKPFAKANGIDTDPEKFTLVRSTPDCVLTTEKYIEAIGIFIESGMECIILDSTATMTPSERMNGVIGEGRMAANAQLISQGLNRLTTLLNAHKKTVLIIINQMRQKPAVMFGSPDYETGGEALKFHAAYRIEIRKTGKDDEGDIIKDIPNNNGIIERKRIGVRIKAIVEKNKFAAIPVDHLNLDIYFNEAVDSDGIVYTPGVDVYKDIADVALACGVISKSSSWYQYGKIKANGMDAFVTELKKADVEVISKIREEVLGLMPISGPALSVVP